MYEDVWIKCAKSIYWILGSICRKIIEVFISSLELTTYVLEAVLKFMVLSCANPLGKNNL